MTSTDYSVVLEIYRVCFKWEFILIGFFFFTHNRLFLSNYLNFEQLHLQFSFQILIMVDFGEFKIHGQNNTSSSGLNYLANRSCWTSLVKIKLLLEDSFFGTWTRGHLLLHFQTMEWIPFRTCVWPYFLSPKKSNWRASLLPGFLIAEFALILMYVIFILLLFIFRLLATWNAQTDWRGGIEIKG